MPLAVEHVLIVFFTTRHALVKVTTSPSSKEKKVKAKTSKAQDVCPTSASAEVEACVAAQAGGRSVKRSDNSHQTSPREHEPATS